MEKERIIEDLNSCWNIETFQEVTSTNDILKQRAPKGLADRTVLIAERQTKGKGRIGRSFYSPEENGIYMSFLLRPQIPPDQALLLTSAAAVAAARARKGFSQKELAQATGIDQSDLSKIERGVANPSIGTLNRIAEALDAKLTVSIA